MRPPAPTTPPATALDARSRRGCATPARASTAPVATRRARRSRSPASRLSSQRVAARRPVRRPARAPGRTASTTPRRRSRPARSRCSPTRGGGRAAGAGGPAACPCSSSSVRGRCSACVGRPRLRRPGARDADDRRHRHPGQDHHHPAGRGRPAARRLAGRGRSARSAPASPARTSTTSLTTPEAPDLHGLFAVMRERGVDGVRDGGLQPRPGAGPRRRRRLRRRGLPQPRPRPPRLPRRRRGLLPRQGVAVHARARPARPGQRRRRARAPARRARPTLPGAHLLHAGPRGRLAADRRARSSDDGLAFTVAPGGRRRSTVSLPAAG